MGQAPRSGVTLYVPYVFIPLKDAQVRQVTPTAFTTFYLGVLANAKAIKADVSRSLLLFPRTDRMVKPSTLPHFEVYFTSSYGMSRGQLEEVNFLVKASDPVEYHASRLVRAFCLMIANLFLSRCRRWTCTPSTCSQVCAHLRSCCKFHY
jgi:hypothetical protein